jgi:hypothetical protein
MTRSTILEYIIMSRGSREGLLSFKRSNEYLFCLPKRVRVERVTARDVVDGNLKGIMRLILSLAAHYKPRSVQQTPPSPAPEQGTHAHPSEDRGSFHTSYKDTAKDWTHGTRLRDSRVLSVLSGSCGVSGEGRSFLLALVIKPPASRIVITDRGSPPLAVNRAIKHRPRTP